MTRANCGAGKNLECCRPVVAENQPRKKNRMSFDLSRIAGRVREFMERALRGKITEDEFGEIALALYSAQRTHNQAYDKLCRTRGVAEVKRWQEIPTVPTAAFKELQMTSLSESERSAVFYSSFTTQRDRSRHFHSHESLALYEESLWAWFVQTIGKDQSFRRIFLTPDAAAAPNSSLVHMFATIKRRIAGEAEFVGIVDSAGVWELDLGRTFAALEQADRPIEIFGTAFLFVNLLDELERRRLRFTLPEGSRVLETGGYKGRTREIPKEELHRLLRERLGVSAIFGEYGMSELSSQAYSARDGLFYFPPWARAQIISPATGREANEGERGLIRVYDLANVWSVMAVQTEDVGVQEGNGFRLMGRAAAAEARGCSLMSV
jgi:hypothetical protein